MTLIPTPHKKQSFNHIIEGVGGRGKLRTSTTCGGLRQTKKLWGFGGKRSTSRDMVISIFMTRPN